jgi:formylglycine-generating enzyme required for sulfatase activity
MERAEEQRRHAAAVETALNYRPESLVLADGDDASELAPGAVFRDCEACPEMVVIPAGEFIMGSPNTEAGRGRDEGPQRRVAVRSFSFGKFDITFDEWDRCVADGGCVAIPVPIDYRAGRGRRPLIAVSWHDAQRCARWLSRETGQRYRLPSEAEWEYAARAGADTAYYSGPVITHEQANFDSFIGAAEPVGTYPSNPFGLHDMAGSVWQWTQDCYIDSYQGAPIDGSARVDGVCTQRMIRGGSWANAASDIRSATRRAMHPSGTPDHGGFRIVRELVTQRR